MKRVCIFVGMVFGVVGARAAAEPWDALRLPSDADQRQIVAYIADVQRLVTPPMLPSKGLGERRLAALKLDSEVGNKALMALASVPADRVDLLLAACTQAEAAVGPEMIDFTVNLPGSIAPERALLPALPARTAFTRIVLAHIVRLTDIPGSARRVVFEHWDEFPELVAAVSQRTWLREGEPFVSAKLLRKIDQETGWWGTSRLWLQYLSRLDSPAGWAGIRYMMTSCQPRIQIEAYEYVRGLPHQKIDLDAAVAEAWRKFQRRGTGTKYPTPYARIAVRHGVADAMVALARSIRDPAMKGSVERDGPVLRAVLAEDFADAVSAADFVIAHRRQLTWDGVTRTYVIPSRR